MRYTENALNIYTLKSYQGIGNAWIVKNLKGNESIERIVDLLRSTKIISVEEFKEKREKFRKELECKLKDFCDGFIALGDENFPPHKGNVNSSDRPVLLFYKGDITLLNNENRNITIIGLLDPDSEIEKREKEIVAQFVKNGATIISGLARGCDTIAHINALESKGKTIAILPSPLNNILPKGNRKLACQIVENDGLLITEYATDFKDLNDLKRRYAQRDRLQALFCDTIVLIASYAKDSDEQHENLKGQKLDSGSRIAMEYAKKYLIPRAVLYDENFDKDNPMFDLNRKIIEESTRNKSEVIIITQDNYQEKIREIMNKNIELKKGIVLNSEWVKLQPEYFKSKRNKERKSETESKPEQPSLFQ